MIITDDNKASCNMLSTEGSRLKSETSFKLIIRILVKALTRTLPLITNNANVYFTATGTLIIPNRGVV